jgi:hypothetical protein
MFFFRACNRDSPGKQMPSLVLRRLSETYFWRAHTGGLGWWGGLPGEGLEGLTSLQARTKRIQKVATV